MAIARRVLVTGAAGFVGANLARWLVREGHEVHAIVRTADSWRLREIRHDLRLHVLDLRHETDVRDTLTAVRPAWVFHLAAHGAYPTQTDWRQMVDSNYLATIRLLDAAAAIGFDAFVNAGTSSEYGLKDHPVAETEWLDPNSYYAATKAAATLFCRYAARKDGLPVVTLRLYSIFGPLEEPTRLMPKLVLRGLRGELPPLTDPETARDFVYIDDAVQAFGRAAERARERFGEVYNVGSGVQTRLGDLAEVARRVFGLSCEPVWGTMPSRVWDTSTWVADPRKTEGELGWRAGTSVAAGLTAFRQWFEANPAMRAWYEAREESSLDRTEATQ